MRELKSIRPENLSPCSLGLGQSWLTLVRVEGTERGTERRTELGPQPSSQLPPFPCSADYQLCLFFSFLFLLIFSPFLPFFFKTIFKLLWTLKMLTVFFYMCFVGRQNVNHTFRRKGCRQEIYSVSLFVKWGHQHPSFIPHRSWGNWTNEDGVISTASSVTTWEVSQTCRPLTFSSKNVQPSARASLGGGEG